MNAKEFYINGSFTLFGLNLFGRWNKFMLSISRMGSPIRRKVRIKTPPMHTVELPLNFKNGFKSRDQRVIELFLKYLPMLTSEPK